MTEQTIALLPRRDASSISLLACCVAVATIVGVMSVSVNRERTCALQESIGAGLCSPPAPGSPAEIEMLRARIARDPGDANAYTALALADRSSRHDELIDVAAGLAPREPNLLLHRARAALERQDWAAAAAPLVELADKHNVLVATQSLAYLVRIGQGGLLERHLTPGSIWLQRLLGQMRVSDASISGALPLVIRAQQRGVIDIETTRGYVRDLKAKGAWADAYALWLSLHGKALPALFNGSFDHAFELDGFDWEVPAAGPARRIGAIVERRRTEGRGSVLELQFTGRAIQLPIVRQYLFIGPGRYRLQGDQRTHQFRTEEGLRWTVRCGTAMVGGSGPIRDTNGLWQPFGFDFTVPTDCGLVASLQLETVLPADAALGARGRVSFDAFELGRIN